MKDAVQDAVARAVGGLAGWAAGLAWPGLPEDVRRRAALILLDDFAAMVAARAEPELIALRDGVARSGGPAEATVFAGATRRVPR